MTIYSILILVIVAGIFIYDRYFSPKGQIKRLWDRVLKVSTVAHKLKETEDKVGGMAGSHHLFVECDKMGALINALIAYHFPEPRNGEDENFVDGHRYQPFLDKDGRFIDRRL